MVLILSFVSIILIYVTSDSTAVLSGAPSSDMARWIWRNRQYDARFMTKSCFVKNMPGDDTDLRLFLSSHNSQKILVPLTYRLPQSNTPMHLFWNVVCECYWNLLHWDCGWRPSIKPRLPSQYKSNKTWRRWGRWPLNCKNSSRKYNGRLELTEAELDDVTSGSGHNATPTWHQSEAWPSNRNRKWRLN